MSSAAPRAITMPQPIMGYFPITFLERGVAIPFTTPSLTGTRVRPGERVSLELLVPNPSGGRGMYILPWTDISSLCRPTLHDMRLIELVAERRTVTPAGIRGAALDVAAEGLAGREAVSAAQAAAAAQQRGLLETNFEMLLALLAQIEDPARRGTLPEAGVPLEQRARAAVATVAPQIGLSPAAVAQRMEELAAIYVPIGVGSARGTARVPRLIAAMADVRQEAADWWRQDSDDGGMDAGLVAMVAEFTLTCVRATLAEAQDLTNDMRGLLVRWNRAPAEVAHQVARSEWLIDGWDRIVETWRAGAALMQRRGILAELAQMLPVIPREAADWVNVGFEVQDEWLRHRRKVQLFEDWRTGTSVYDQVARNEHIVAQTTMKYSTDTGMPP